MILAAAGISLLSASCGGYASLADEELEQARNHRLLAGPEEVTDAVMEAFEEMDNPFEMHIERTSETSALAERTAMLYMLIISGINDCRFAFKAGPGPDGGTDANPVVSAQAQALFPQPGRSLKRDSESRNFFRDSAAVKLGEGGGVHSCPGKDEAGEDVHGKYDPICLFADIQD